MKEGTASPISPARRWQQMDNELVERGHAGKPTSQRWWVEYDRVRRAAERAERVRYDRQRSAELLAGDEEPS